MKQCRECGRTEENLKEAAGKAVWIGKLCLFCYLEEECGYTELRTVTIADKTCITGLKRMIYTTAIAVDIDDMGNMHTRYCFKNYNDAKEAVRIWDGTGDPPGPWLKKKGNGEYRNPKHFGVEDIKKGLKYQAFIGYQWIDVEYPETGFNHEQLVELIEEGFDSYSRMIRRRPL